MVNLTFYMLALLLLFITLLNQTNRQVQCDSTPKKLNWHQKLKSFFRSKPKKKPLVIAKLNTRQNQIPKTVDFIRSTPPIYYKPTRYTPPTYKTTKYTPVVLLPLESSLARNVRNDYEREKGFTDTDRKKFDARYLSDSKVDEGDIKLDKDKYIFDDGLDKPVDYTTFSAEIDDERYDLKDKNRGRSHSDWTDNKEFVHALRLQPALVPPSSPVIDVNGKVDVGAMFGMREPLYTVSVGHSVLPIFEAVHGNISQPVHVSTAHNNKQGATMQGSVNVSPPYYAHEPVSAEKLLLAGQSQQLPSAPIVPKTYLYNTSATQSTLGSPSTLPTLNPNISLQAPTTHFTPVNQALGQQRVNTPVLTNNSVATPHNSNNPIVPPTGLPNQTVVSNGQIPGTPDPSAPSTGQTSSSLGNAFNAAMPIVNAALPFVATAFPPAGAAIAAVNAASPLISAAIPLAPDTSTLLAGAQSVGNALNTVTPSLSTFVPSMTNIPSVPNINPGLNNPLTGSLNALGGAANSVLGAGFGAISAANSVIPSSADTTTGAKSLGNTLDPRNLSPPNLSDLSSSTKNAATNLLSNAPTIPPVSAPVSAANNIKKSAAAGLSSGLSTTKNFFNNQGSNLKNGANTAYGVVQPPISTAFQNAGANVQAVQNGFEQALKNRGLGLPINPNLFKSPGRGIS